MQTIPCLWCHRNHRLLIMVDIRFKFELNWFYFTLFLVIRTSAICHDSDFAKWKSECVGFACEGVSNYRHSPCCVQDMSEQSLRSCVSADYQHVMFPPSNANRTVHLTAKLQGGRGLILDGGAAGVTISGHMLQLQGYSVMRRVVIENVAHNYGLQLAGSSFYTWIHQCVFRNIKARSIYIGKGYSRVTVSWSRFEPGPGVVGATYVQIYTVPSGVQAWDSNTQVTLHHNYFHSFRDSAPSIRYGYVHAFNNVLQNWTDSGVSCTNHAKCLIEANLFTTTQAPSRNIVEVQRNGGLTGNLRCVGNVWYEVGGRQPEVSPLQVPPPPYAYTAESVTNSSAPGFHARLLQGLLPVVVEVSPSGEAPADAVTTTTAGIISAIGLKLCLALVTLMSACR